MIDAEARTRIFAAIDAGFDAQVAFLQELVRFPSLRGREAPLQDWIARQLAARGYAVDRFTIADVPLRASEDGADGRMPIPRAVDPGRRRPSRREPDRAQPDPAGAYRRGAGRPARDVDPPALCRDHPRRLDVRPRRA